MLVFGPPWLGWPKIEPGLDCPEELLLLPPAGVEKKPGLDGEVVSAGEAFA